MAIILKPRITIYAFNDTTYATQLYTYNAFTDSGATTKPISMQFESTTTGAGSFSIEIEDSDGLLDQETFIKGNRIFIECSKDGSTWQPAFKGLIRSVKRSLFGALGSTFTISGYSYLVRLNERILNTIRESTVTGGQYDRTDSTMFTNNLINSILTTDSNYVYGLDDTQQYSVFKTSNIASSPITTWIPRLDAQLTTVSDAISSILEFSSNALMVMDPANDQLVLFDPQQIASGANVFLVTDQPNLVADDAAITMYPIEPYTYDISYDYPDSGSRLISSIGNAGVCPEEVQTDPLQDTYSSAGWLFDGTTTGGVSFAMGNIPSSPIKNLRIQMVAHGNCSAQTQITVKIWGPRTDTTVGGQCTIGGVIHAVSVQEIKLGALASPSMTLYKDGIAGTPFPDASAGDTSFIVQMASSAVGPAISGNDFTMGIIPVSTQTAAAKVGVVIDNSTSWHGSSTTTPYFSTYDNQSFALRYSTDSFNVGCYPTSNPITGEKYFRYDIGLAPGTKPACGGLPALADADPVFAVAEDKNMSKRLGMVERVVSDIPTHVRTAQTMNEYLFARLFTASKPRFTFDFPAVSIPTKIPKAGDIVAHVSKKAGVGTKSSPLQTGVIMSVNYEFRQDDEGIIGLTKMGLSTTGIRRGYY
jgi:hypothetical protein